VARRALEECLELDPENIDAKVKMAQAVDGLDKPIEANTIYREVLSLDPSHLEAKVQLGTRELNMIMDFELLGQIMLFGRIEELTDFQHALLTQWDMTLEDMIEVYKETLEIWKDLVKVKPENAEFWGNLAAIANLTGNYEGSVISFLEALRLDEEYFSNRGLHQQIFDASAAGQKWVPKPPI